MSNNGGNLKPDTLPMSGVALLIVLIMMLIAPDLMRKDKAPVKVPLAHTAEMETEDAHVVAVTSDNRVYFDDSLSSIQHVKDALSKKMSEDPYYLVIVRGDQFAKEQWVMDVVDIIKKTGAQRIAIATRQYRQ